jgi:hypothetical protein
MRGLDFEMIGDLGGDLVVFHSLGEDDLEFFVDCLVLESGDEFENYFVVEEFVVALWVGVFAFSKEFVGPVAMSAPRQWQERFGEE